MSEGLSVSATLVSLRASLVSFSERREVSLRTALNTEPEHGEEAEVARSKMRLPDRAEVLLQREATRLSLSQQALSLYHGPQAAPAKEKQAPHRDMGLDQDMLAAEQVLNTSNLDEESKKTLLLLLMLFKKTDDGRYERLMKDIESCPDLAARFHGIVDRVFETDAALRAAVEGPQPAPQEQAQAQAVAQAQEARPTTGATVTVVDATQLNITLMDETVVQVRVEEKISQEDAVRLLDSSQTVAEFAQKTAGQVVVTADPLVLDLKGDGISRGERNFVFDLNADGERDRVESLGGDDALLFLDLNQNGRLDDGLELFGDQHGAADGFEELRRYDENGDHRIDATDSVFEHLQLAHDVNGDGLRQADEWETLQARGVAFIELPEAGPSQKGEERASAYQVNGQKRVVADLFLGFERMG